MVMDKDLEEALEQLLEEKPLPLDDGTLANVERPLSNCSEPCADCTEFPYVTYANLVNAELQTPRQQPKERVMDLANSIAGEKMRGQISIVRSLAQKKHHFKRSCGRIRGTAQKYAQKIVKYLILKGYTNAPVAALAAPMAINIQLDVNDLSLLSVEDERSASCVPDSPLSLCPHTPWLAPPCRHSNGTPSPSPSPPSPSPPTASIAIAPKWSDTKETHPTSFKNPLAARPSEFEIGDTNLFGEVKKPHLDVSSYFHAEGWPEA